MSRPIYPFDVKSRDVWSIALPAALASVSEPIAGITDITVIGRLGDAGMLGGLVLGALVFDFIFSMAYFLRTGTAGLTAQAVGARDPLDGILHVSRAIMVGTLAGLLMIILAGPLLALSSFLMAPPTQGVTQALADYFNIRIWSAPFSLINYALLGWFYGRARAKTAMGLQLLMHVTNIVLSILFVYGFGWGVSGAALGTVVGQGVACLAGLYLLAQHFGSVGRLIGIMSPVALFDTVALRRMFGLSRDLMIRSMALMASYCYFAAQGSRLGEIALSSNAILLNFLMVSGYFLDGMALAAEQLCGKAVGANYRPAFTRAYALAMRWGLVIAAGLSVLALVAGWSLIEFMTTSETVRAHAHNYLWLAALAPLTGMPAFVFDGILVGATLNVTMRNGMLTALSIFLVAAMALQPLFGNVGLWLAIHIFFLARAGYYWRTLDLRMPALFTA